VVDAHIHLWDPARLDWYPYLTRGEPGMCRFFDVDTYRAESSRWNVEKIVNVAAATGLNSIDETIELDARAEAGHGPDAIIGGLPPTETVAEAVGLLDRQMTAARFRGVRPMGPLDRPVPDPAVLRALDERRLVFELMTHPDRLVEAAGDLAGFEGLNIVVEHTGWPRSDSRGELDMWKTGMQAMAELGGHVTCKLSGLAMPLGTVSAPALAPWIEYAIETFGVDRCFFASNFPVDSVHGTFDELYESFNSLTAGLDPGSRAKLFADNAERIYRI
jgi:predicted TIM-barrel fold metal-dependent hydrolase